METTPHTEQSLTLTVPEAAKALGISNAAYYAGIKRCDVPGLVIGRRIVVPRHQLDKLLRGEEWRVGGPQK